GGGGGGGLVTARGAGSALTRVTWVLAAAFMAISLVLTIISARDSASRSVLDGAPVLDGTVEDGALPPLALPPAEDDDLAPDLQRLLTPAPVLPGGEDDAGAPAPFSPPAAD
ncbi:MAG: preprotein translocase subunit SecG, partial [Pseudomonadota bacterium]